MIPFIQLQTVLVGPLVIQVWGLFVSIGIAAAIFLAYFLCKKYFFSGEILLDLSIWVLVGAFIMARIFHVVFYNPVYFSANPEEIIKIWHGGASSLGGFFGAVLSAWLFAKKRKFTFTELLPYFDISVLALWLGWGIGRIGCFLIHDHPGTLTDSLLGVQFPGGARFDLGLLESLLAFVLFIVCALLFKRLIKIRWGLLTALSAAVYAFVRFWLDFLRIPSEISGGDVRYLSLTPAQWGMLAVLAGLTLYFVLGKIKRQKSAGRIA